MLRGMRLKLLWDGSIPEDEVKRMIADSYDLVTDTPTKRIYEAVKRIPKGKVATYGTVATMAGNPRMSRAVGNALHKNPDPEHIPCHRVVNAKGELADAFVFALKISPVEICGIAYFSEIILACVPLPAPGAPNITIFIQILQSEINTQEIPCNVLPVPVTRSASRSQ